MLPMVSGLHQENGAITKATEESPMLDSWESVAIAQACARNMSEVVADAQAIVDRHAAASRRAHRQLGHVQRQNRELVAERTARHRQAIMDYLTRH